MTHGQFAFTTHEAGSYLACFTVDGHQGSGDVSVNIDWKTGIAAKDWDTVARKEKIEVGINYSCSFCSFDQDFQVPLEEWKRWHWPVQIRATGCCWWYFSFVNLEEGLMG